MPELHFPFVQGQHEEADARILPAGMLSLAQNCRIRKDGRLVSRWGYRFDTAATFPGSSALRAISVDGGALVYDVTQVAYTKLPIGFVSKTVLPGERYVSLFSGVTRTPAARGMMLQDTVRGEKQDCIVVNPSLSTAQVIAVYDDIGSIAYGTVLISYSRDGKEIARSVIGASSTSPILAAYGSAAYCAVRIGTVSKLYSYSTATLAWTYVRDLTAYDSTGNATGDAVLASSSKLYHLVFNGGAWRLYSYNTGSTVYSLIGTLTTITGATDIVSCCEIAGNTILVTGTFGGIVKYEAWTSEGQSATGTLFTATESEAAVGACTVAAYGSYWVAAVTTQAPGGGLSRVRTWYADAGGVHAGPTYESSTLQSRPFVPSYITDFAYAWIADSGDTFAAVSASTVIPQPTLRMVSIVGRGVFYPSSEATAMVQQAYGGAPTGGGFDCRRSVGMLTQPTSSASTWPRIVHHQPRFGQVATDLVWVDFGAFAPGLSAVSANGQTFVSGARLWEFDGVSAFPAGLENGPDRIIATDAGSGSGVDIGTHQYVACWQTIDANGNVHRSPPSPIATVTLAAAHNVTITMPQSTMAPVAKSHRPVHVEIYRTEASGTIFRLVGTAPFQAASFSDTMPDASLPYQPALYTQGERGGLSGLLPNEEPPPCRFICAGDSRIMLGGLENQYEVQWSKLFYPGEAVSWTTSEAYRRTVPEPVTGVAFLDGAWIVFTESAIYDISGLGPSDNGADGDFGDPRKRPSDIGCISHRSIVSTSQGLLFQGTNGGMWLLPRGGNAPVWIGQPVRDTLAAYPVVRDACLIEAENCVYWSLCDATGATGVLLVYDLRIGQWYVDDVDTRTFHSITNYNGVPLLNGLIPQTPNLYVDDFTWVDPTAITVRIDTGDIRPFGETGWGRCRLFGLLGEVRTLGTSIQAGISYDGGTTWADTYSWNTTNVATAPGDELKVQFGPRYIRGTNYRISVQIVPNGTGAEGVALNVLSLEVYKSERLARLPAAQRG